MNLLLRILAVKQPHSNSSQLLPLSSKFQKLERIWLAHLSLAIPASLPAMGSIIWHQVCARDSVAELLIPRAQALSVSRTVLQELPAAVLPSSLGSVTPGKANS